MTDFAEYAPGAHLTGPDDVVDTRSALSADADALAAVMAVRGGSVAGHVAAARRLIARLDVLRIAEKEGMAVGWCGVQKASIFPDSGPEWLIAGVTVIPEARRRGIAARLLREVLQTTPRSAKEEPIFSVVNARNLASVDLHHQVGFVEVRRSATFAGIEFTGGEGVLLRYL
nr:GNAT family N-acetyltransferase [Actinomyces sp.]